MNSQEHLREARDCIERSWEKYGNTTSGALAADAHQTLARAIAGGDRENTSALDCVKKAEDLLKPGRAGECYGNTNEGLMIAGAYARQALSHLET